MSIVPLVKITVYGHTGNKAKALVEMQEMGNLHLIPLNPHSGSHGSEGPSPQRREALKFLLDCPLRRRQVKDPSKFDAAEVEGNALELKKKILMLEDERDFLRKRIQDLEPWGDFVLPPNEDLQNQRLWFYVVPHYALKKVETTDLKWKIVHKDNRFFYVVVISKKQPAGMPVSRTHTGKIPLSKLKDRLDEVEIELEDLQALRASQTRWVDLFTRNLNRLEDQEALSNAIHQTYDQDPLFAIQAWAPGYDIQRLQKFAADKQLALMIAAPGPDDLPPTLLQNPPALAGGQDLVSFYMTPSYWGWDPSLTVFFSFSIFFAMILSDAGYAFLLGVGLLLGWRRMEKSDIGKRLRVLFSAMITMALIWGVITGSYFGISPPEGSYLASLKWLNMNDSETMMRISIFLGISHVVLANIATARHFGRSLKALAPWGWAVTILGATALWMGTMGAGPAGGLKNAGIGAMCLGGTLVLLFTSTNGSVGKRLLTGLQGLYRMTSAFGDILSYLRLFALGLASTSLALAFNDLARQISADLPGFGKLLAFVVVIIGHGLNLALAIMSGFVHGLRLNFIEFFNWGVQDEGHPFHAFSRKEKYLWNN